MRRTTSWELLGASQRKDVQTMGLDLTLGILVLIAAVRGWFRGFLAQAIRIGGAVGGVYLADPLRQLVRPLAVEHLPSMQPGVLDKLLWWLSAVTVFVVLTGVATMLWKVVQHRQTRPEYALSPPHRGDQSAGALFGAAKGALVAAFLLMGIEQYASKYLEAGGWAGEQVETSKALAISMRYQPARTAWESDPVQQFVQYVRRMGIEGPPSPTFVEGEPAPDAPPPSRDEPRTARRPKPLEVPPPSPLNEIDAALKQLEADLEQMERKAKDSR